MEKSCGNVKEILPTAAQTLVLFPFAFLEFGSAQAKEISVVTKDCLKRFLVGSLSGWMSETPLLKCQRCSFRVREAPV